MGCRWGAGIFMILWALMCSGMAQAMNQNKEQELSELKAVENMLLHWTRQCNVSQAYLDECKKRKSGDTLQLWGERHSGTNMIEHVLKSNFRIDDDIFPFGFKHLFVGEDNETIWEGYFAAAREKKAPQVVISRSLYDWTDVLKNDRAYQGDMPDKINREMSFEQFVTQPWKCINVNKECFKNLMDLREHKFRSFIANLGDINVEKIDEKEILERDAGRAIFLRYEDVSADFGISVACRIANKMKLCPVDEHVHPVVQIVKPGYKLGTPTLITDSDEKRIKTRDMWKAEKALATLNNLVDWDVEKYMGYKMLTKSTPSDDKGT